MTLDMQQAKKRLVAMVVIDGVCLAVAVAGVVWYAIAINFGVDSTLLGLRACGLIPESGVAALRAGPFLLKSPVFLGTAIFWIWTTRKAIMMRLSGVVVALMKVYAPSAVLLLTATAIWGIPASWARAHPSASTSPGLTLVPVQIQPGDSALTMMMSGITAALNPSASLRAKPNEKFRCTR